MHAPVFRNLDLPFRVLGLNPIEWIILSILFLVFNEISNTLDFGRLMPLALTILAGVLLALLRRELGSLFLSRLLRFVRLPSSLSKKVDFLKFQARGELERVS